MHLRPLQSHEAGLHRDLRLRALLDSPHSFADTFAEVSARPPSYWEDLTQAVTRPGGDVMFLACEANDVLGSVYAMRGRAHDNEGRIGGTWVQAEYRNRGIAGVLIREVFAWARRQGLNQLGLWAPAHEPAALALYLRAGFRETGEMRLLPTNSSVRIVAMKVQLGASPA